MSHDPGLDIDELAALVADDPDYRVLRRFAPHVRYWDGGTGHKGQLLGAYVDCETTGLDTTNDRITEFAMLPFWFDVDGHVYDVGLGRSWYNDPGMPIPPEATAITGITDDIVRDQHIDVAMIEQQLTITSLVIAHNADFDRKMVEREIPGFALSPWACSYREVPWGEFGCACSKLSHILNATCNEFYAPHRALDDCYVGLHVLATAEVNGRTALRALLESTWQTSYLVWALGAVYETKDALKQRGYRWNDGRDGRYRAWHKEVRGDEAIADEKEWLASIACYNPDFVELTALTRYSVRAS